MSIEVYLHNPMRQKTGAGQNMALELGNKLIQGPQKAGSLDMPQPV